jgi:glycosyltransferase involved in cell wall biosynthesis
VRVLGFGTYDVRRHPRVGIILEGLRAHGVDVSEVNIPLGFTTADRVEMLGRPWLIHRLVRRLLVCWVGLIRHAVSGRSHRRVDAVVVGYLGHFDVLLARMLFPGTTIVLDLLIFAADTARDRGVDRPILIRMLGVLDRLAVACADVVLVDTPEHALLLPPRARSKAVIAPVGAAPEWFAVARPQPQQTDPLRAVFFGLFTPLQGGTVIGEAVSLLADRSDIRFTIIGSGQDHASARALVGDNPAVTWLDWVEPEDLPGLVAAHDVCLGIFGTTSKALRVVPNKVSQGAAAGCVVITSETDPQRRALQQAAVYVPPGDAAALASALRSLASDRSRVVSMGAAARELAVSAFTPARVAEPLLARLAAVSTRGSRSG